MKRFLRPLCTFSAFISILLSQIAFASEVTIFNRVGEEAAYIDADNGGIFYLWEGKPVAYLSGDSIYAFNGRHLGWLEGTVIRDNNGYVVGSSDALGMTTFVGRIKGIKDSLPIKSPKQLPPHREERSSTWSEMSIEEFLLQGK